MLRERQQLADSLARILAQLGLERKTRIMDLTHVLREARDAHDADDGGHDRQEATSEATSEPETAQEPVRTAAPNSKTGDAVVTPDRMTPQRALAIAESFPEFCTACNLRAAWSARWTARPTGS